MTCCFSPSAVLMAASRWPSDVRMSGALLALGAHLLFHRRQDVLRRLDVLDLVAQHLDAPGFRRLVHCVDHLGVDGAAFLERAVQIDLAHLASQRGLRQLRDGEHVVRDAVGGALGVEHLEVQDAVHAHLDVVARDADLRGDVERLLLERVPVADDVDERHQDVEAGVERGAGSGPGAPRRTRSAAARRRPSCRGRAGSAARPASGRRQWLPRSPHSGLNVQFQSVDGDNAAAFARDDRAVAHVVGVPQRPAHLGLAVPAGRQARSRGRAESPTSESTTCRLSRLQPGQQRLPEEAQRRQGDDGEDQPLRPRPARAGPPGAAGRRRRRPRRRR